MGNVMRSDWEREEHRAAMERAVSLVRRFGNGTKEIAEMFGVAERTVRRWVAEAEK